MNRNTLLVMFILLVTGTIAAWMLADQSPTRMLAQSTDTHDSHSSHTDEHDHDSGADDTRRGPHGGRLLVDDAFSIEITIFEKGLPPEFHVYAYLDGKPLPPEQVDLRIELTRLGSQVDRFSFTSQQDYLRGSEVVAEPHSFDVSVVAEYLGQAHHWAYENHEGRTQIPSNMAIEAGIHTETAGPVTIRETLNLTGQVQTDPDRLSRVRPRFPGVVQTVRHNLGDVVQAGDVLASVQSNESLQTYPVKAPITGLIVRRDIQVGEATGDAPLFIIADLSAVWAELDVFGRDLNRVQAGQAVEIETFDSYHAQGEIDWISPMSAHASQSVRARVRLANPEGRLRPGQFVRGRITLAKHAVPLAVRLAALQRFRDFQVVFARFGDIYEVRMLDLGRQDSEWVEVLGGLAPGTEYVTSNSYLIKADIEKSGASHDH